MLPFAIFLFCAVGIVAGLVWLQLYDQSAENKTDKGSKSNYLPIVIGSILLCLLTAAFLIFFKPGSKDDIWQDYKALRAVVDQDIDDWSAYDYVGIDSLINDKMEMLEAIDKNIAFINSKSIVDNDFDEVKKELRAFHDHRYFQAEQLMELMRKNTFSVDSKEKDMEMIISDLEDEITILESASEEDRTKLETERSKLKASTNRTKTHAQGFKQQLDELRNGLEEKQSEINALKLALEKERTVTKNAILALDQEKRKVVEEQRKGEQMMAEISRLHLKMTNVRQLETEVLQLRQEKKRLEQRLARYSNVVPVVKNESMAKP